MDWWHYALALAEIRRAERELEELLYGEHSAEYESEGI